MSYHIISMQSENHRQAVLNLWEQNLAKNFPERYEWFFDKNPAGTIITCLAVNDNNQEIVGCGSLYPRKMKYNNQNVTVGIAADFIISENHRAFGPALPLQRVLSQNGDTKEFDFLFAFPNRASKGLFQRVGYKVVGYPSTWVKVLKSEYKLIQIFKNKVIAKIGAFFLDTGMKLLEYFQKPKFKGVEIQILNRSDKRFDLLWLHAKDNYKIIGEKDAAYLTWRYKKWLAHQYQFFCLVDKEKQNLLGYIAYTSSDHQIIIGDFFALDQNKTAQLLLFQFVKQMRNNGFYAISMLYFGNKAFKKYIKRFGFWEQPTDRPCMIFTNNHLIKQELLQENNWFLFDADMDL